MTEAKKEIRSPTYRKCERIMEAVKKKTGPGRMARKTVIDAISLICGSDKRTIDRYLQALAQFGFLKVK